MTRNLQRSARRTRRRFLASVGVATAGVAVASNPGTAATTAAETTGDYVLEQGDRCVPVVPLSGEVPVEERYGWAVEGADFSAQGLVDLQRPDTSILFLYDGPNGLSLVVVHDKYGDGTNGGSATFEFTGLPVDGTWAVRDDYYGDSSNFDQWARDADHATVDWTWAESRTDGGAFRGLGTDTELELRIEPSFNAAATLSGVYYEGEITDWEVLSASGDGLTRTALALDEPVLLRRGTCSTDGTDEATDGDATEEETEDSNDGGDDEQEAAGDDDEDDHPGNGKGHEKGKGKGHEKGKGKGHEKGKGKGHEKGKGKGHEKGKGKGHEKGKGKGHEKHGDDDEWDEEEEEEEDDEREEEEEEEEEDDD